MTDNKDKTEDDNEDDSDDIEFKVGNSDKDKQSNIQPRWKTRVFAATCLRKILEDCCQGNRAHFDLSLAREIQFTNKSGDFLVLHLSELVRVAFMATTSDSDPLRLEGLKTLEVIIERFGETPEPEFPGMCFIFYILKVPSMYYLQLKKEFQEISFVTNKNFIILKVM